MACTNTVLLGLQGTGVKEYVLGLNIHLYFRVPWVSESGYFSLRLLSGGWVLCQILSCVKPNRSNEVQAAMIVLFPAKASDGPVASVWQDSRNIKLVPAGITGLVSS